VRFDVRRIFYSCLFLFFLAGLVIIADILAGQVRQTELIRESARQFREEAAPLFLKTRYLVPGVNHLYSFSDGAPPDAMRRFRTDNMGVILGPENTSSSVPERILFLGGSTTETNEVDEAFRFPYLVGKLLSERLGKSVEGLNLGVRGNTSRDSLNLLINHPAVAGVRHVARMHNINDRLLLSIAGTYEASLNSAADSTAAAMAGSGWGFIRATWDYVSYRSNILFLLRNLAFGENAWTGEEQRGQVHESTIDFPDSHFHLSQNRFRASLQIFVAAARAMGKSVTLVTQPLGRPSAPQEAFNDIIREVAADTGALLVDVDRMLTMDREVFFFSDQIHLNNDGSKGVAELIAARLGTGLFGLTEVVPSVSGAEPMTFEVCLPPPQLLADVKSGSPHRLLKAKGRYPVFSSDRSWIVFQSWRVDREVVRIYDRALDRYRDLSPETGRMGDRHATPVVGSIWPGEWIVFGRKEPTKGEHIFLMDVATGDVKPLPVPTELSGSIPASDSSGRILFAGSPTVRGGEPQSPPDLYRFDPRNGQTKQLTRTPWEEWRPVPSPEARYVYYIADPDGQFDLFRLGSTADKAEKIYGTAADEWDPDVSTDGRWLVFASHVTGSWDLYMLDLMNPEEAPLAVTHSEQDAWDPRFVPGSDAIVFAASRHNSPPETYWVCPFGERSN
jgi:Tol biopolymer transport system component